MLYWWSDYIHPRMKAQVRYVSGSAAHAGILRILPAARHAGFSDRGTRRADASLADLANRNVAVAMVGDWGFSEGFLVPGAGDR